MSDTKHPERRAGQRWRYRNDQNDLTIEGVLVERIAFGWRLDSGKRIYDVAWPNGFMAFLHDAPAVAPLAVDRTGCSPCCGMTYEHFLEQPLLFGSGYPEAVRGGDRVYCSPVCRDERLPPLAAHPAEAKCSVIGCVNGSCVNRAQRAETKPHISKCMEMCQEGTCADCDREFAGALRIDAPCPGQCGGSAATDDGPCARCKPAPQPKPVSYILPCGYRVSESSPEAAADAKTGHVANCAKGCNDMLTPTQIASPQPAPAKLHDFSDPYCARRRATGTVARLCTACGAAQDIVEARTDIDCRPNHGWREVSEMALCDSDGILRGPKISERLPRPKLAHVAGMHDDDLIGGG